MAVTRECDDRICQEPLLAVLDGTDRRPEGGTGHSFDPSVAHPTQSGASTGGGAISSVGRYSLYRIQELLDRLGPVIYEDRRRGEPVDAANGIILERGVPQWTRHTMWRFACDCVERVLPLFERAFPYDDRPRRAIETTRRHLAGRATADELNGAWNAADRAVQEIRGDVPWDAGLLAGSAAVEVAAGECQAAIWMATRAAARAPRWTGVWMDAWAARRPDLAAALADAWDIASREERTWQVQRLKAYLAGAAPGDPTVHAALDSRVG